MLQVRTLFDGQQPQCTLHCQLVTFKTHSSQAGAHQNTWNVFIFSLIADALMSWLATMVCFAAILASMHKAVACEEVRLPGSCI